MKNPSEIISNLKKKSKSDNGDPEKMDVVMRTIRSIRLNTTKGNRMTLEEHKKHRSDSEKLSKLISPGILINSELFNVEDVPCEKISPKFAYRQDKIILYCHGGGFTNGGLSYARVLGGKLANSAALDTFTFEYRLAPEYPYPAAIEDAVRVWDFLMQKGYGAKDIVLAGDSAGANIALELCFTLRKNDRMLPKALVLMSPWCDMTLTSNSYNTYADKDPMLTYEYVDSVRKDYAGDEADFADECYSPLFGDFTNMPPLLIQVGSHEILKDDSEKLHKKYIKAGCQSKLEIYPGCWHVFQQSPVSKAGQAMSNIGNFIIDIL